jgi:hypothetical protein
MTSACACVYTTLIVHANNHKGIAESHENISVSSKFEGEELFFYWAIDALEITILEHRCSSGCVCCMQSAEIRRFWNDIWPRFHQVAEPSRSRGREPL